MGVFAPALYGFVLPHPRLTPYDKKIFLTHPHLLGPKKILPYLVKLYFLLICPTIIIIFFNKICFFNKNILEITTKFIPSNQTIF